MMDRGMFTQRRGNVTASVCWSNDMVLDQRLETVEMRRASGDLWNWASNCLDLHEDA